MGPGNKQDIEENHGIVVHSNYRHYHSPEKKPRKTTVTIRSEKEKRREENHPGGMKEEQVRNGHGKVSK